MKKIPVVVCLCQLGILRLLFLLFGLLLPMNACWADDGDEFTAKTKEGVEMLFRVVSEEEKTCEVYGGDKRPYGAISSETEGALTVPSEANGYKVVAINEYGFYGCEKLTAVNLPPTIISLGFYSFNMCTSLSSMTIPSSCVDIDSYAFGSNYSLMSFTVEEGNANYFSRDGLLLSKSNFSLVAFPGGIEGDYTIPSYINRVGNGSFCGCSLTKLTFPETVTDVGGWVACSCPKLKTLVWETAKAQLSDCGFRYCSQLETVSICEGVRTIPGEAFERTAIKEIVLPNSVAVIGAYAFSGCYSLKKLTMSTRVTTIGKGIFEGCRLTDLYVEYHGSKAIFRDSIPSDAFASDLYKTMVLHVPTGTAEFFRTTGGWKQFQNIVEQGEPVDLNLTPPAGDIWGYYAGEELQGYLTAEKECAMFIPGNETLVGAQITSIRVPVYRSIEIFEQGKVWLAESLEDDTYIREVAITDAVDKQYNEIVLDEPYTITEKGVYVGMTCPESVYVVYSKDGNEGLFFRREDGSWYETNYRSGYQIRVTKHHIPQANAYFGEIKPITTQVGQTSSFSCPLYNNGLKAIENIDYTIWVDGTKEDRHQDVSVYNGIGQEGVADIEVTPPASTTSYEVRLVVNKVNGVENPAKEKTSVATFSNLDTDIVRNTVMEEATGTWCGWCVRGFVGMNRAKERFGDRFIGIAVHGNDVMDIDSYYVGLSGYPSCLIDRNGEIYDPYYDIDAVDRALKKTPQVGVTVQGTWGDRDRTEVKVNAEVFVLQAADTYNIFYALVGDGLTGTGSSWAQKNFYSGSSDEDPDLQAYCEKGSVLNDMVFNDVALAYKRPTRPFVGTFNFGATKSTSATLSLPTETELADAIDKEQIYVVAVVLNADGTVANAAKAKVVDASDGIDSSPANSTATVVGCYTLDGYRLDKPCRGINIVRMSDGKSKKIIVK